MLDTLHKLEAEEIVPHTPATVWAALTDAEEMHRWMMAPTGFAPRPGTRFTFQTTQAGAWDGVIRCEVLDVVPNERLAYAWQGGHEDNVGYGSRLDTIVTWTLSKAAQGTRLRVVHAGFVLPRNETAYNNLGAGWKKVVGNLAGIAGEFAALACCGGKAPRS